MTAKDLIRLQQHAESDMSLAVRRYSKDIFSCDVTQMKWRVEKPVLSVYVDSAEPEAGTYGQHSSGSQQ